MQIVPTIWAGTLSVGLSVVAVLLCVLYMVTATGSRILHIALGVATILVTLVVLSSGVDSILVHHERSLLVFAGIALALAASVVVIVKRGAR